MAVKLKPFDAAKYIEDVEDEADVLNDALATGHVGYIAAALGAVARARGMTELAQQTGLNRQALYSALSANGNPTLDTVLRIARALNIELRAVSAADELPKLDPIRDGGSPGRGRRDTASRDKVRLEPA